MRKLVPLAFALAPFSPLFADVTLPPLISDNMLLQQPKAAVWGKADPGEKVTVSLGKISASATASQDGKWRVELDGLTVGNAGELTVEGKNKIVVQNVAVGEVWVGSGQSNMQWAVRASDRAEEEIAAANFPQIRMFSVPRTTSLTPVEDLAGKWTVCTPQNVPEWSAVGYYFARTLHHGLKRPVGIIHTSWGGTVAQAWTPEKALNADLLAKSYLIPWHTHLASLPAQMKAHEEKLAAWTAEAEAAKAAGQPAPRKPKEPAGPTHHNAPSVLYNAMIHGATPYTIKGFIWYQGESNTSTYSTYQALLTGLITSWRTEWKLGELPFLIVQLANYMKREGLPSDTPWAELREQQRLTSIGVPNTHLAVAIDIGAADNIHPKNKQEVGRRLALIAQARTYGEKIVSSGPFYEDAKFEGSKATIRFKKGTAEGLTTTDGGAVQGFAIAGEDQKFVWAEAKIETGSPNTEPVIVVSSPEVLKPVAIRYAWANNPATNLVNKDKLPAVPFRIDL